MRKAKLYISFLALVFCLLLSAQAEKSELIFFNDQEFTNAIENILEMKNNCGINSEKHNWYIEELEDGSLIMSINRIGNLLQTLGNKKIYTSILNNKIIFYISLNNSQNFSSTGFYIDFSRYRNYEYVLFEDFSSWRIIQKENSYFIIDEQIWECD